MDRTVIVIGCGPSLNLDSGLRARLRGYTSVACNRAIEVCSAKYWVWVDRVHHERSRWHANARRAVWVGPADQPIGRARDFLLYEVVRSLPTEPNQLYLRGGTLTVAAHLAARSGARRIVFLACDAWDSNRDRYHEWDGAPLDKTGLQDHRVHLEQTAQGIQDLARRYANVEFLDATEGRTYLGLPRIQLDRIAIGASKRNAEVKMAKSKERPVMRDESVPMGYGKLISVMPLGPATAVLWFEDSAGTIRALRVRVGAKDKFGFAIDGQAQIVRN